MVKVRYVDFRPMFFEVYGLQDLPILLMYQIPVEFLLGFVFEKGNYLQLYLIPF